MKTIRFGPYVSSGVSMNQDVWDKMKNECSFMYEEFKKAGIDDFEVCVKTSPMVNVYAEVISRDMKYTVYDDIIKKMKEEKCQ